MENVHTTIPKTPFEETGGCSEAVSMENGLIIYVHFVQSLLRLNNHYNIVFW